MAEVPTFRPQVGGTNLRNVQGVDAVGLRAESQLSQQVGAFFAGELEIINQKEDEKAIKRGQALGAEIGRNTTSLEDLAGNLQTTDTLLAQRLNDAAVTTFMDNSSSSFNQKMSAAEAESPLNAAAFNNTMSSYLSGVSQSIPEDVRPLFLELSNKKIAAQSKNIEQRQMKLSLEQSVEAYSRSVEVSTSKIAKAQLEGNQNLADRLEAELKRTMASARASGIIASDEALRSQYGALKDNIERDRIYFEAMRSDNPYDVLSREAKSGNLSAEQTMEMFNSISTTVNQLQSQREQSESRAKKEQQDAIKNLETKLYEQYAEAMPTIEQEREIRADMLKLGSTPEKIEKFLDLVADPPDEDDEVLFDEIRTSIRKGTTTTTVIEEKINNGFTSKRLTIGSKGKLEDMLDKYKTYKSWPNYEMLNHKISKKVPRPDLRFASEHEKNLMRGERRLADLRHEEIWNQLVDMVESGKVAVGQLPAELDKILNSEQSTLGKLNDAISQRYPNNIDRRSEMKGLILQLSYNPETQKGQDWAFGRDNLKAQLDNLERQYKRNKERLRGQELEDANRKLDRQGFNGFSHKNIIELESIFKELD